MSEVACERCGELRDTAAFECMECGLPVDKRKYDAKGNPADEKVSDD